MTVALVMPLLAWLALPLQASDFQRDLEAEFLNKIFVSKIAFGNSDESNGTRSRTYLVDTELFPGPRLKYNSTLTEAEPGYYDNLVARGYQLSSDYLLFKSHTLWGFKAGTPFRVVKVELKGDRVELLLRSVPADAHAKLKLMIGKDARKTANATQVAELASNALVIERIERVRRLASDYEAIQKRIDAASASVPSTTTAAARLQREEQLASALQAAIDNRLQFATSTNSAADTAALSARLREVSEHLPTLRKQAEQERIAPIKTAYDAANTSAAGLKQRATGSVPQTLNAWQQQADAITAWETNLAERRRLRDQLVQAGEQPNPLDVDAETKEIEARRASLDTQRRRIDLARINAEYASLEKRRSALRDAYSLAFGTKDQAQAAAKLIDHLKVMQANRLEGEKAGAPNAKAQIEQLASEIARLRR